MFKFNHDLMGKEHKCIPKIKTIREKRKISLKVSRLETSGVSQDVQYVGPVSLKIVLTDMYLLRTSVLS